MVPDPCHPAQGRVRARELQELPGERHPQRRQIRRLHGRGRRRLLIPFVTAAHRGASIEAPPTRGSKMRTTTRNPVALFAAIALMMWSSQALAAGLSLQTGSKLWLEGKSTIHA